MCIRDLAHACPRLGYRQIWVFLRREGWLVNLEQMRRRKHIAWHRGPAPITTGSTERWSMDFVHDILTDRLPVLGLTVVDS